MEQIKKVSSFVDSIKSMMEDVLKALEPDADPQYVQAVREMLQKFINS